MFNINTYFHRFIIQQDKYVISTLSQIGYYVRFLAINAKANIKCAFCVFMRTLKLSCNNLGIMHVQNLQ
ncbi:hypothetical protein BK025_03340 [Sodalis sp. TME1]|nr:hypothetical protein BK025_03340 [Sodalis sp. TME1]